MARFRSTGDPALDMALFGVALVIVLMICGLVKWWQKIVYFFAPKVTEPVTIRKVRASAISWNRYTGEEQSHIHSAEYERADGTWGKVYITHEEYIMLREGVRGLLTHKGRSFVSFEKEEE